MTFSPLSSLLKHVAALSSQAGALSIGNIAIDTNLRKVERHE